MVKACAMNLKKNRQPGRMKRSSNCLKKSMNTWQMVKKGKKFTLKILNGVILHSIISPQTRFTNAGES